MSSTRTFRVENSIYDAIQELARKERVSVNLVANRALRRFVEWDASGSTRGLVSIPRELLVKLMDSIGPAKARELGNWAGTALFLPNMKYLSATVSIPVALSGIRMLSQYGSRFGFDHSQQGRKHIVMIRHSMGRSWSAYYAGTLDAIFRDFFGKKLKMKISAEMCVCEFEE